jgi:SAM-dependent methyltransferase
MATPILRTWRNYFEDSPHEGLGSSYERVVLNLKLEEIRNRYGISTCLEAPVFGFTGLTGINSLGLARSGVQVTLVDDHAERLRLIRGAWDRVQQRFRGICLKDFEALPFADKSFDLGWNFAALWFVPNIREFLRELVRVTQKVIFFGVPNRWGLGFLLDKYVSAPEFQGTLKEENILPLVLTRNMKSLGWDLVDKGHIDVPPWPDIGMKKEEFLKVLGLSCLVGKRTRSPKRPLTIMNYYDGTDLTLPTRMLRYYGFERNLPGIIKKIWAHHSYFVFALNTLVK